MARAVAPFLAARPPGSRVIVSNRPGAGGQVGTEAVANAAPDGFTLGACATPTVLSQPIERPVRWRAAELTCLVQIVEDPCGLFVLMDSPLHDLPGLLAAARKRPADVSYGTAGIGGDDHIAALLPEEKAGVRLNHVPYQRHLAAPRPPSGRPARRRRLQPQRGAAPAAGPRHPRPGPGRAGARPGRGLFGPPKLPEPIRAALEGALDAIFADPAWTEAAARAGLVLRPLVGGAYREAALRAL